MVVLLISIVFLLVLLVIYSFKRSLDSRFILPIFFIGIFSQLNAVNVLPLEKMIWIVKPFMGFYYELNNTSTSGRLIDLFFTVDINQNAMSSLIILITSYVFVLAFFHFITIKFEKKNKNNILSLLVAAILIDIITRLLYGNYAHDFIYLSINKAAYIPDIKDIILLFVVIKYIKTDIDFMTDKRRQE